MIDGKPTIYLHRHWPEHLHLSEAKKLTTPRLLAYYRKHYSKKFWFQNGYPQHLVQGNDAQGNAEWGCSPSQNFVDYFDALKAELDSREHVDGGQHGR